MVLIFNSMVSREISRTNFTPTRAIAYMYIYNGFGVFVAKVTALTGAMRLHLVQTHKPFHKLLSYGITEANNNTLISASALKCTNTQL